MENFVWPFVGLILPLPLLVWFIAAHLPIQYVQSRTDALRVPFFDRIEGMAHARKPMGTKVRFFFLTLAWIALVGAGMRPFYYDEALPTWHEARNIMLTIDMSTSMAKKDFDLRGKAISRIDIVKNVVRDFMTKRVGDRLGLVIFGTTAHTLAPLSNDMKTLDELFADVDLGVAGEQTAIGDALALAVQDTAKIPEGKKIIILLSDGYNNAGVVTIPQAIELAKKQKIAVYTIGIGAATKKSTGLLDSLLGGNTYGWDEQTLNVIAQETGGKYFRAQTTDDLISVYKKIDKLETTKIDSPLARPKREVFYYPLFVALFCWMLAGRGRRSK